MIDEKKKDELDMNVIVEGCETKWQLGVKQNLGNQSTVWLFFFFLFFTLLRFALAVSFFKSKIRLVAKKVEEFIVFYSSLSSFFEFGICNRAIWLYLVRLSRSCFIWLSFLFFFCVGFRFINNWNPIFNIHFLIFSKLSRQPNCDCVYGHFDNFDN